MTLDQILDALRELGVLIPEGMSDAQLTNQGKALNPWTVSTGYIMGESLAFEEMMSDEDIVGPWYATTNTSKKEYVYGNSEGEAVMKLLLKQLGEGRYTLFDTHYKSNAARRSKTT